MATERLSMQNVREILRQKLELKRTHRAVAKALGISNGAVGSLMVRWQAAGLEWDEVKGTPEAELEQQLYGPRLPSTAPRPMPDMLWLHRELMRPAVTLELLHLEYLERHPDGYRYSRFCDHYKAWLAKQRISMRQEHRAGEKLFIDYSGRKASVVDPRTGEVREAEIYVAVMGASSFVYAEATWSQQLADFVGSTTRALEFLGGVPQALVIDNLKAGVTRADRYEGDVNRTYVEMARHYGTVVLPARPYKPKDKAKVEVSVQVVQRWILARLRNRVFHSLGALNEAIDELLDSVNGRVTRHLKRSREQLFAEVDKPALKPLPATRYEVAYWKTVHPSIDYHVELFEHLYSVPHALRNEDLDGRATATTVEIFLRGERVASHPRSFGPGHTTLSEHMPKSHRAHAEWTPSRFLHWAGEVGTMTQALVKAILEERPHPEMGYRSCLGILKLAKKYGPERLEKACARAVRVRARSYRHVATMLEKGLEAAPLPTDEAPATLPLFHENVRGRDYYH
jgi:transposase